MEIPTPPTDSLYKFAAIGGIILMVAALYISYRTVHDLREREAKLKTEMMVREVDLEERKERRKENAEGIHRILEATEQLEKEVDQLPSRPPASALEGEKKKSALIRADLQTLRVAEAREVANREALSRQLATLEGNSEAMGRSLPDFELIQIICGCLGCFGALCTVWGFKDWRQKIQGPQDELLQIQLEQARLVLAKAKAESAAPAEDSER